MLSRLHEERVRQEEQQAFLARVLDASPLGVVTLDLDGRVDSASRAAAALLEAPARRAPRDAARGGDGPRWRRRSRSFRRAGRASSPHGGARRVRIQRSQFLDRGFPRTFFLLVELTEELRLSEKAAYEKLIRMMSHEVNNSGAAVGSLLDLAPLASRRASRRPTGPTSSRRSDVSRERTERLNAFMRSLAEVVRVPEPRLAPADPNALARSVVLLLGPARREARRGARARGRPGAPPVPLDAALFEQALFNVVKNGDRGGRARAAGSSSGRRPRGAGRSRSSTAAPASRPRSRPQLFTPFFTTKPEGQGVGLTFVREVLAGHGFRFSLAGPPGGPTRFAIAF